MSGGAAPLPPTWINSGAPLWPRASRGHVEELLAGGRWLLHHDHASVLLVGADVPIPTMTAPTADSAYRQLALAMDADQREALEAAETHYARALEMSPHLVPACEGLARVQVRRAALDRARHTARRCQAMFPDPARRAAWRELLAATAGPR